MEGLASLKAKLNGQEHSLAWINRNEAQALKDMGGSGKPGPMGIPAFYEDETEDDDVSWSDDADFGPDYSDMDEEQDDFMQAAYGAPGFQEAVDPGFGYIDDFFGPQVNTFSGTLSDKAAAENPGLDAIDLQSVVDAQIDALEKGYDVNVGFDPESGTLSYDGPDALSYGLSSIGQGLSSLGSLGFDMVKGMESMMPGSLIASALFGNPTDPYQVGARALSEFGITSPLQNPTARGVAGLLTGEVGYYSQNRDAVVDAVKDALGIEAAEKVAEETKGMTEQEFQDYMDKTFGSEQSEGLYE